MTAGQLLASLSGLQSGSAATHIAAISTGAGETIYARRMMVMTGQRSALVISLPKAAANKYRAESAKAAKPKKVDKQERKGALVITASNRSIVISGDCQSFVFDKTLSGNVLTRESAVNISRWKI